MSLRIAELRAAAKTKPKTRAELLALMPDKVYDDGRTKQCHADECDINKIMARFDVTGTISHLEKHEGSYSDFSDYDYHTELQKLTRGREIFDDLSAEVRREFGQNPAKFFAYVNDPKNAKELRKKLPGLAEPGQQLPREVSPTADHEAAEAAASEVTSEKPLDKASEKAQDPEPDPKTE